MIHYMHHPRGIIPTPHIYVSSYQKQNSLFLVLSAKKTLLTPQPRLRTDFFSTLYPDKIPSGKPASIFFCFFKYPRYILNQPQNRPPKLACSACHFSVFFSLLSPPCTYARRIRDRDFAYLRLTRNWALVYGKYYRDQGAIG